MTTHTPKRLPGESREAYRARRAESAAWSPLGFVYPTNSQGQYTDIHRAARRKQKRLLPSNRQWRRRVLQGYRLKAERLARLRAQSVENAPA